MIMILITLLTSLMLAVTAAWFSVAGLITIFSGQMIAAIIMGSCIEAGKLVGVSWLYRNWKSNVWFKWPLVVSTIVAMIITSIGIFGFLSKAHIEQGMPTEAKKSQIEVVDQRIAREQEKIIRYQSDIANYRVVLNQLDAQVQKLIENNRISDPTKGAKVVREGQKAERDELSKDIEKNQNLIDTTQDQIAKYKEERTVLMQSVNNFELETGPIKYIAALVYDDPTAHADATVRIMIMLIIITFDPLAIFLLMAANHSMMKRSENMPVAHTSTQIIEEPSDIMDTVTKEYVDELASVEEPAVEIYDQFPPHEETIVEEPIVEEPTIEEPTIEEPTIEEPIVEEPIVEEPKVKKTKTDAQPVYNFGVPKKNQNTQRWANQDHRLVELLQHYQALKNKKESGTPLQLMEEQDMNEIGTILARHGWNIYI